MSTPDVLLALLARGPAHGYDLKRAHDAWFDRARPLAFGQVYSTLARLERDGRVAVAHTEAGGGPERTVYEITPQGRERLGAWLAEPVDPAPPGADELIRKAVAAIRLGLDPAGFLARQRAAHLRRMASLEDAPADGPTARLVLAHALAHLDADLRWLETALEAELATRPTTDPSGQTDPSGPTDPSGQTDPSGPTTGPTSTETDLRSPA